MTRRVLTVAPHPCIIHHTGDHSNARRLDPGSRGFPPQRRDHERNDDRRINDEVGEIAGFAQAHDPSGPHRSPASLHYPTFPVCLECRASRCASCAFATRPIASTRRVELSFEQLKTKTTSQPLEAENLVL